MNKTFLDETIYYNTRKYIHALLRVISQNIYNIIYLNIITTELNSIWQHLSILSFTVLAIASLTLATMWVPTFLARVVVPTLLADEQANPYFAHQLFARRCHHWFFLAWLPCWGCLRVGVAGSTSSCSYSFPFPIWRTLQSRRELRSLSVLYMMRSLVAKINNWLMKQSAL